MEDKIVEIARFYEPEAAQMIESLLKSEGVNCYLRNEYNGDRAGFVLAHPVPQWLPADFQAGGS